ncbi:hypothetical protein BN1723_007381 [Verticillium longisporum]|uniref:Uncharacterized protein n=1 Tax=Verticillium longisporum TaxID=100787 RepID=A0A0G4NL91_VERLO|nr:hypothetical protein BN1723_007381 [Verticillium longisporum]
MNGTAAWERNAVDQLWPGPDRTQDAARLVICAWDQRREPGSFRRIQPGGGGKTQLACIGVLLRRLSGHPCGRAPSRIPIPRLASANEPRETHRLPHNPEGRGGSSKSWTWHPSPYMPPPCSWSSVFARARYSFENYAASQSSAWTEAGDGPGDGPGRMRLGQRVPAMAEGTITHLYEKGLHIGAPSADGARGHCSMDSCVPRLG